MQCPQCGDTMENFPCPSCGYSKFGVCVLAGSSGEMKISVDTTLGNRNLAPILSAEDLRYFASLQFRVEKSESVGAWILTALPDTSNDTLVNGVPCSAGDGVLLENGAVVAVGSKKDASIVRGEIKVEIID